MKQHRVVILAGCALALVVSACSGEVSGTALASTPTEVAQSGSEEARFYASTPGQGLVQPSWFEYDDFREFANAVDVVFVGTVASTKANVLTLNSGDTGEDPTPTIQVLDGIEFEIVEILSGSVPGRSGMLLVGHPALVTDTSRPDWELDDLIPVRVEPIETLKPGIDSLRGAQGKENGPMYLVFASVLETEGSSGLWHLNGPGSVAPLGPDGRTVLATGSPPFVSLKAEQNLFGYDVTLDVIRDWIKNGVPAIEIPEEYRPQPSKDS